MQRPPRDPSEPLLAGSALMQAALQGLGVLVVVLALFIWGRQQLDEPQARALAFSALVLGNLALILSNRAGSRGLLVSLRVPNRMLWAVTGFTVGLLALALYLPVLTRVLQMAPLSAGLLGLVLAGAVLCLLWFEVLKRLSGRT